jgi:micrococcal nuclease
MKWLLLTMGLALAGPASASGIRVIDGDTLEIDGGRIRILNIDAPEIRSYKCPEELSLGLGAKFQLSFLVSRGKVTYEGYRLDKYHRLLAHVYVDGKDVGQMLIDDGYAVKWEGRRHDWC